MADACWWQQLPDSTRHSHAQPHTAGTICRPGPCPADFCPGRPGAVACSCAHEPYATRGHAARLPGPRCSHQLTSFMLPCTITTSVQCCHSSTPHAVAVVPQRGKGPDKHTTYSQATMPQVRHQVICQDSLCQGNTMHQRQARPMCCCQRKGHHQRPQHTSPCQPAKSQGAQRGSHTC